MLLHISVKMAIQFTEKAFTTAGCGTCIYRHRPVQAEEEFRRKHSILPQHSANKTCRDTQDIPISNTERSVSQYIVILHR